MRTKVRGRSITGPRLTGWGALMILAYLGLPVMGALVLLDVFLYLVFTHLLGRCYGLLCWMG
ncbi:MAG TPA: hypothetical protein VFY87_08755 [Geminicoccaceae bacterium]|nr:hypothetical protein [Geminicoccaceae bacterium]